MVGEARGKADVSERGFGREHLFASGADAEAVNIVADAFFGAAAKNAGEMDGMDASFAGELVEGEAAAVLGLEFVQNAGKPCGSVLAL